MVRAALLENSKPEKCSMKSEASQDSVDKQAYQLGKYFLIYHSFLLTNNSITAVFPYQSTLTFFCFRSMDKKDEEDWHNWKNFRSHDS